jgi:phi13 family phage major tail protein
MAIVGLQDIVYAKLIKDDKTGVQYEEVKPFAQAITAQVETAQESATQYADNGPIAVITQIGETTLTLTVDEIPLDVLADILGYELKNGVLIYKQDVVPPYVALGFKGNKSSGGMRYVWLYKGRFAVPSDEWNTKTDSPEFQNQEITGTFIRRDYDKVYKVTADTDIPEFAPYKDSFFDSVFDLSVLDGTGS